MRVESDGIWASWVVDWACRTGLMASSSAPAVRPKA